MMTNEWQSTGDFDALLDSVEGFNVSHLDLCRNSADITEKLSRDNLLANDLGVAATPTFLSRRGIHVGIPTVKELLELAGERP